NSARFSFGAISIIGGNNIMKLQKLSLFGAMAGALLLTATIAPRAHAAPPGLLTYYNFEKSAPNNVVPYTSDSPGLQTTTLSNDVTNPFPSGNLVIPAGAGTTMNIATGTVQNTNAALDLAGNA